MAARLVLVRALKNFDQWQRGEEGWVRLTIGIAHLVANQYLTVVEDPWRESGYTEPSSE
jgi:hypothetical protein